MNLRLTTLKARTLRSSADIDRSADKQTAIWPEDTSTDRLDRWRTSHSYEDRSIDTPRERHNPTRELSWNFLRPKERHSTLIPQTKF